MTHSVDFLQTLLDFLSEGVVVINATGAVSHANLTAERILGYAQHELQGKNISCFIAELGVSQYDSCLDTYQVSDRTRIFNKEILLNARHKHGYSFPIKLKISEFCQHTLYTFTDVEVNEYKQVHENLIKSKQSLNEAQKMAHIGNWEYIPDTGELIWSEELYHIFELEGQPNDSLYQAYKNRCHPDDLALLESSIQDSLTTGKSYQLEHRIIMKNGTTKYLCCLAETLQDKNGQVIGLKGTSQDISKQKEIEAHLEKAIASAHAANLAKDAFLANMSHELRTPLTGILGMADMLLQELQGPLNSKQVKSLETIQQSGQHLLNLINDILDLSKVESGRMEIILESAEAEKLAREALSIVKQLASQKDIRLALKVEPFDLQLSADTRHLKQILVNLLSNAIKFTPQQGQVSLTICKQDTSVKIEVCDTGIGISPENQKKLFQPFIQIDSILARQSSGTGLGLSLVKRMIEAHGGSIHVCSEEGKGSCFSLLLPQPQEQSSSQEDCIALLANTLEPSSHRTRILLIDDNPVNIDVIQTFLEHMDYQVEPATCGKDALSWLEQELPDLVLMDIQMPEMDGFELIQRLRQSSRKQVAELRVVALTSLAMNGDQERIMKQGFDAYMSKPVDLTELKSVIEALISSIQHERCL